MDKNRFSSEFKLGILGGGQLGRMFIQEAINYNIDVHILDADPVAPSSEICKSYTIGSIQDYETVFAFGKDKDVLTVEIENVNVQALFDLEKKGVRVFPQPRVLEIIKDKGLQKEFYALNNIPTAPFQLIEESENRSELLSRIPFVMKLRTGGYDGRGVQVIKSESGIINAFNEASVLEELIPFDKELSVIVARNERGETAVYPSVECEFNDANLVEYLFAPADITNEIEQKAQDLAVNVINKLDMIGILAVEMFLTTDGELLVNEIAPRPHNSGHHTIECNITSQFEQHLRSVVNLPLGATDIIRSGAMLNILGANGYEGTAIYRGIEEVLKIPGTHIHLYGKEKTKFNRKMGHLTITGENISEVKETAVSLKGKIQVVA